MATVNHNGYVERITHCGRNKSGRHGLVRRSWWLVKTANNPNKGRIVLTGIDLPSKYIGKRIRFKVEIIDEVK